MCISFSVKHSQTLCVCHIFQQAQLQEILNNADTYILTEKASEKRTMMRLHV